MRTPDCRAGPAGAHTSAIHLYMGSPALHSWTEHAVIELGSDSLTRSHNKASTR